MLRTYKITLSLFPDCQELCNIAREPDGKSTMNYQFDFADLKSRFFNQLCPCGNSDRSHFSYIEVDGEILLRECTKCLDIVGLDDSTYDEVLSWLGDTENIRVSLCDCGNENPEAFVFEQLGDDIVLRCGKCRKTVGHPHGHKKIDRKSGEGRTREWVSSLESTEAGGHPHGQTKINPKSGDGRKTKHVSSDGSTKAVGHPYSQTSIDSKSGEGRKTKHVSSDGSAEAVGHPYSQTKIDPKSAWKLRPGDHITWERLYGINHHAIVVRCSRFDYTYVRVIHYTSPKGKSKMTKGVVVENWVDLFKENGDLYRVEYKPESLDSDEVIARAQSLLGKDVYNLFTNNCEHFARLCKTGVGACEQVESAMSTILHTGAKNIMVTGAKAGARYAVKNVKSLSPLANAWKTIGAAAATVVVAIELYSLCRDVKEAKDQLRAGKISQQECINIVLERGCRTVGAAVGTVAGSCILIPVVGTLVGSTLGSLIGKYVGRVTKRVTSSVIAAKVSC